tara:strand:- start:1936 stop:3315 length:1380 start_codon:yes stop_codon:yes gene_type:complete
MYKNNADLLKKKEIKILRNAVDNIAINDAHKIANDDNIKTMITILENFLKKNKILCYGGTAINNLLPNDKQFYNRDIEIPDYDFFSPNALKLAHDLANIYYNNNFKDVEAKSGVHEGTYKVFVNFVPIADITQMDNNLFSILYKQSITINKINYCPPNFLRMAMYLELSRPNGDITRWEKILKRIILLNEYYPIEGNECSKETINRPYMGKNNNKNTIYNVIKNTIIDEQLIFFGAFASSLYKSYIDNSLYDNNYTPDFDILSNNAEETALLIKKNLINNGIKNVKILKKKKIIDYLDEHYIISIDNYNVAVIYNTKACYSYNEIIINNKTLRIATIDTMLSFYLIFIYINRDYFDTNRILCMAQFLFNVQFKNRLKQKGLLKRFVSSCYGTQETLRDIRIKKSNLIRNIIDKKIDKNSEEYLKNFYRYIPNLTYYINLKQFKNSKQFKVYKKTLKNKI